MWRIQQYLEAHGVFLILLFFFIHQQITSGLEAFPLQALTVRKGKKKRLKGEISIGSRSREDNAGHPGGGSKLP